MILERRIGMIEKMKRLDRKLVYKGAILDIYKDTMQFANGKTEEWDFVAHRMGAAAVLPVLPDGRILMVRQYRNALERETIEIPAGCRDSLTEDTKVSAIRELEEETGYHSDKVSFLISLRTTVAFCNESIDVYLAENLTPGEQRLDDAESIDVEIYTLEELCDMIYQGKIQDSKTVAAIMAYSNKVAREG
jgi:ADP-ribose pyrophosphatase